MLYHRQVKVAGGEVEQAPALCR